MTGQPRLTQKKEWIKRYERETSKSWLIDYIDLPNRESIALELGVTRHTAMVWPWSGQPELSCTTDCTTSFAWLARKLESPSKNARRERED